MGEPNNSVSRVLPLALQEGRLLEILAEKLQSYLPQPDVQMILDDLRSDLYADLDLGSLKTLHSITLNCRKCPNLKPDPQLPAWNKVDPDCLFILDMPPSSEIIDLIIKSLTDAGFSSKRVCLTYLNRCAPSSTYRGATQEEINNCSQYLMTEIQLLQPKLIVPLGVVVASTLCGAPIKLANDRGKVLWLGPWAIMPTYSPMYVLKAAQENAASNFAKDLEYAYRYCYGDSPK